MTRWPSNPRPYGTHRARTYKFRQWLANVPIISLVLLKLCHSDSGSSVFHAEWRWRRCPCIERREDVA